MHENWNALSAQLEELISEQRQNIDEHLIERFIQGYDRHITLEEPLFEMGRECLSADILAEMGKNMSARRQVKDEISLNLTALRCPIPILSAKKALKNLDKNDELMLILNLESAVENFSIFAEENSVVLVEQYYASEKNLSLS